MNKEGGGRLIMLFVEDIPEVMDHNAMVKLFAKFGRVRDVHLPRKRSRTGKQFGFVRYDCEVAAEVAIKRTNGLWLKDKELKVKFADLHKVQGKKVTQQEITIPYSYQGMKMAQRDHNTTRDLGRVEAKWVKDADQMHHRKNQSQQDIDRTSGFLE
ncbi:RNA recognition motif-containing protein [Dionaea muscipula]